MMNSPMASAKPFFIFSIIFSVVLPFMLITIALQKQHQQLFLSLRIELDQIKSKVSVLESYIEKGNHELRSKEDDIAQMEMVILEKEESIASLKNKIDSILQKGSIETNEGQMNGPHSLVVGPERQVCCACTALMLSFQDCEGGLPHWLAVNLNYFQSFILAQWNNCWRPALDGSFRKTLLKMSQVLRYTDVYTEMVKTEWMPVLKDQVLTFISHLKPHFDFLTAETVEAYHASKNILLSHVVKLQRSATPFMQEWIPVLKNQMLNFMSNLKPHFDFLSSETLEAYNASKKFLLSHVVKLQRSATPFMQELHKYAKPHMNQIATLAKIYLDTALVNLGILVKKIIIFLHDLWNG